MLIAEFNGEKIEATAAPRGHPYRCPHCKGAVIFKRGRRVIWHFAHKPPTDCTWAAGETRGHLGEKALGHAAMSARGRQSQVEYVVAVLPGDRRADVMAWSSTGQPLAFELQHTSIGLDEIEARSGCYARAGIAQIWIPFLSAAAWSQAEPRGAGQLFLAKYPARPFERWVHGLNGKDGMWMYAPWSKKFWHARLAGHQLWVEESTWFEAGGEERSAGGFYRWSKRYRELTLTGPYEIGNLDIAIAPRSAATLDVYNWPAGLIARFVPVSPVPTGHR